MVSGGNLDVTANLQSQFSYQNTMLLIKFHAGEKLLVPSRI